MKVVLSLAMLSSLVVALRDHENRIDEGELRMEADSSSISNASAQTESVSEMRAGAVLRGRYVLKERTRALESQEGFPQGFPPIARKQFQGRVTHLGTGSFGDTWEAYDSRLGKNVAVKLFYDSQRKAYLNWATANQHQQAELKENVKECNRVKDWMRQAGNSVGANRICQCYEEHITDATSRDWYMFLVLEMCGKDFDGVLEKMAKTGAVDVQSARQWIKQVVEGIYFLTHLTPPWMHHDLKPGNIVMDDAKQLKLIDWGGALEGKRSNIQSACVSTPAYAAPEAQSGMGCFSFPEHSYDIFAAGLMYMQFLCPKVGPNDWIIVDQRRQSLSYRPLREKNIEYMVTAKCPQLGGRIAEDVELIAQMLRTDPQFRTRPSVALTTAPLGQRPKRITNIFGDDDNITAHQPDGRFRNPIFGDLPKY